MQSIYQPLPALTETKQEVQAQRAEASLPECALKQASPVPSADQYKERPTFDFFDMRKHHKTNTKTSGPRHLAQFYGWGECFCCPP